VKVHQFERPNMKLVFNHYNGLSTSALSSCGVFTSYVSSSSSSSLQSIFFMSLPLHVLKCFISLHGVKGFWQYRHIVNFYFLWVAKCLFKLLSCVNVWEQFMSGHRNGLSLVWILKWSNKLCHFLNNLPHSSWSQMKAWDHLPVR
jgi:hypothetical protein